MHGVGSAKSVPIMKSFAAPPALVSGVWQVIMDHIEKLEKQARAGRKKESTAPSRSPHHARCHG